MNDGSNWSYMLQDGLGSVRAEIGQNVAVNGSQSYAPYGEVFGASGTMSSPFAFTGEPLDGNGLQYHRARYYAPEMGVWANQDFLETSNRYGYVGGNPINLVDLNGLFGVNLHDGDRTGGVKIGIHTSFLYRYQRTANARRASGQSSLLQSINRSPAYPLGNPYQSTGFGSYMTQGQFSSLFFNPLNFNAIVLGSNPAPQPQPTLQPTATATATATNDPDCRKTTDAPHTTAQFDSGNTMEDIMCNVKYYTGTQSINPYSWWKSLQGKIIPKIGRWVALGEGGGFIGINPGEVKNRNTGKLEPANLGDLFLSQPGHINLTRADIMTLAVHELRHAGQYHDLFKNERIKGQKLSCLNTSGHMAEADAWLKANNWVVDSKLSAGDFGKGGYGMMIGEAHYNNGAKWTESIIWNHQIVMDYEHDYDDFDAPPAFTCPQSSKISLSFRIGCVDALVGQHI